MTFNNSLDVPFQPAVGLEGGPESQNNIFLRLLKSRVIMLGSDVNDDVANQICAQLLFLEGEDPKADVWLYVNSPGGSITAGMAIYDTMQFISCDVATVCLGLAASMGQFLLTAGTGRQALHIAKRSHHDAPATCWLAWSGFQTLQFRLSSWRSPSTAWPSSLHITLVRQLSKFKKDSERDRWFTPEKAKEYGLVDKVIVKRGEIR
jgi:ATP-dependent Clp protease, protease subunit